MNRILIWNQNKGLLATCERRWWNVTVETPDSFVVLHGCREWKSEKLRNFGRSGLIRGCSIWLQELELRIRKYAAVKYDFWGILNASGINMHGARIRYTHRKFGWKDFELLGLWMRFSKHQRAPNLHSPLNLEHKSLQDVYRVTQSEPIRASYRPVEFALFKKNTSEGTRGSRGRKRKRLREKERVDMCESILNKCSPPSRDFPKKQCCCVLTSFPQLCCVFLITCPKTEEFAWSPAHEDCRTTVRACSLRWAGSSTHHRIDFFFFLWTIGAVPSRGGEETSVWHQGDGENEGVFKGGRRRRRRRRKGRIFWRWPLVFWKSAANADLSINKSEQAMHVRTKRIRDGTFLRLDNRLSRPCIKYSVYSASCREYSEGVLCEDCVNAEAFLRFPRTWCNYRRRLLS